MIKEIEVTEEFISKIKLSDTSKIEARFNRYLSGFCIEKKELVKIKFGDDQHFDTVKISLTSCQDGKKIVYKSLCKIDTLTKVITLSAIINTKYYHKEMLFGVLDLLKQ